MKFNKASILQTTTIILLLINIVFNMTLRKDLLTSSETMATSETKPPEEGKAKAPEDAKAGAPEGAKSSTGPVEGWMRISSPKFANTLDFPEIRLPESMGSKVIRIDTDGKDYRLNPIYKDKDTDPNNPKNLRDFYFRITENHLYYSLTKTDINIVGVLPLDTIMNVDKSNRDVMSHCIDIIDANDLQWNVCNLKIDEYYKFLCAIQKGAIAKGASLKEDVMCTQLTKSGANLQIPTEITEKITKPIILIPTAARNCNDGWNYQANGDDWECLCKTGLEQSPIDLPKKENAIASPVAPLWSFKIAPSISEVSSIDGYLEQGKPVKVRYMNNMVKILHNDLGSITTLDGANYIGQEVHFHTPSEHTIDGQQADLEVQFIFYGVTKGDIAKTISLSFLFNKKSGMYNKFIDDIDYFNLPNAKSPVKDLSSDLFIPKIFYNSLDENIPLMQPFSFYTYQGSLTSPPCSESMIHYVASDVLNIASVPLQLLAEANRFPDQQDENGNIQIDTQSTDNYRKPQPLNGRKVFFFNHTKYCGDVLAPPKVKVEGHYEKIPTKAVEYYYVQGENPSGLPDSYMVTPEEAEGKPIKS